MRDVKSIVLVIVIVVLIGSAGVLTYMISNGQDPLVLFNTRASSEDEFADPNLLANAGDASNDPIPDEASPTPTISFTSTSPTLAPSGSVNPTMTPRVTPSPIPVEEAELPETGGGTTVTPTPIEALPVAGPSDFINPAIISGAILILLAMIL